MQPLFAFCSIVYLLIYAFEGAIRYGLYNIGMDSAILLRDALVIVPLTLLLIAQGFRLRLHPAFAAFGAIVALHGLVSTLNLHNLLPAIYGASLLIIVLFGFFAGPLIVRPSHRVLVLFAVVWLVSVVGLALDKFVYTMPWTGLETHIGGIKVDVSRGWDIDGEYKRVAGFTRSSIAAALLVPTLGLIIAPRLRSVVIRLVFLVVTCGAVALTTQKGSLIACCVVSLMLCAPARMRYALLSAACVAFAVIDVALPLVTSGLLMPENGGVFSFASFGMRIMQTWPDAWLWISNNEVFPFGVGLGGIGGAQRFYAADFFNPSDNLFVFLYANFGILGLLYLGWLAWIGQRISKDLQPEAIAALAVLAFNLGYGMALSMLEDQMSALFIGAAAGCLWQLRQMVNAGQWSDPYAGARRRLRPTQLPAYATVGRRLMRAR